MHRKRRNGSTGIDQQPDGSLKIEGDVMGGGADGEAPCTTELEAFGLDGFDSHPALHITFKHPRRSTVRGYRTVGSP